MDTPEREAARALERAGFAREAFARSVDPEARQVLRERFAQNIETARRVSGSQGLSDMHREDRGLPLNRPNHELLTSPTQAQRDAARRLAGIQSTSNSGQAHRMAERQSERIKP